MPFVDQLGSNPFGKCPPLAKMALVPQVCHGISESMFLHILGDFKWAHIMDHESHHQGLAKRLNLHFEKYWYVSRLEVASAPLLF